jgi:hypothetical protein
LIPLIVVTERRESRWTSAAVKTGNGLVLDGYGDFLTV